MWESILAWIKPTSLSQVVSNFGILVLLYLAIKGRIASFGANGILFTGAETDKRLDTMEKLFSEHRVLVEKALTEITETVLSMKKEVFDLRLDQQKQLFYDADQRAEERMIAGLRYVKLGGNGAVKKDLIAYVKEHRVIYDAVCFAIKDLRLPECNLEVKS